jgi:Tfp pilus assembly protein FimV
MRIVVAALATLALIAGAAGDAGAQGHAKKRHKHAKAQVRQPAAATAGPADGYIVRDANQLPVGSSIW